jgi:hypothetical protein
MLGFARAQRVHVATPPTQGTSMNATPDTATTTHDEGQRHLQALIDALDATRFRIDMQLHRYALAKNHAERGDVLHDAIVAVEDRLSPRCRLDEMGRLRDAYHLISDQRRR